LSSASFWLSPCSTSSFSSSFRCHDSQPRHISPVETDALRLFVSGSKNYSLNSLARSPARSSTWTPLSSLAWSQMILLFVTRSKRPQVSTVIAMKPTMTELPECACMVYTYSCRHLYCGKRSHSCFEHIAMALAFYSLTCWAFLCAVSTTVFEAARSQSS
jgi:hypothetical protein